MAGTDADVSAMNLKMQAAGLGPSETSVFVRNIPEVVEDGVIRDLLTSCGQLSNWARPTSSEGLLKAFGFAHFRHPEGAMRAFRLLKGVQIIDKQLEVQIAGKTQKKLDEYEAKVKGFLSKERVGGNTVDHYPMTRRDELDAESKKKIDAILLTIQNEGVGLRSKVELQTMDEKRKAEERKRKEVEEADRKRLRVIEKERRRREEREKGAEDRYRRAVRKWEDDEHNLKKRLRRLRESLEDDRAKRRKLIEEEEEDTSRIRRHIRSRDAMRVRMREKLSDERFVREQEEAKQKAIEEAKRAEEERERAEREAMEVEAAKPQPEEAEEGETTDHMDIDTEPAEQRTAQPQQQQQEEVEAQAQAQPQSTAPSVTSLPASRPAFKLSFGGSSAPSAPTSRATNLESGTTSRVAFSLGGAPRRDTKTEEVSDTEQKEKERELAKNVVKKIPTTKEELFAFEINWSVFDETKVKPWIGKKMVEILGEEEEMLTRFVMDMLKEHDTPHQVMEKLHEVLDDETEMFVIKLWRFVAFSVLMEIELSS